MNAPKWCQEGPKRPKTEPEAAQNDPQRSPRGSKKRTQTTRRKKDRTKSIPRPSWTPTGPICLAQRPPPGAIWEAKSAQKRNPKRSKIEAKNKEDKITIQDDLGPVLERSWVVLGRRLGLTKNKAIRYLRKFQSFSFITKSACYLDRVHSVWKVRENHIFDRLVRESQGKSGKLCFFLVMVRESQGKHFTKHFFNIINFLFITFMFFKKCFIFYKKGFLVFIFFHLQISFVSQGKMYVF